MNSEPIVSTAQIAIPLAALIIVALASWAAVGIGHALRAAFRTWCARRARDRLRIRVFGEIPDDPRAVKHESQALRTRFN